MTFSDMPFLLPALGVFFGIGLILTAFFSRPWSRLRFLLGVAIVLAIVASIVARERAYAGVDLNPVIPRWQSLSGTWQRGNTLLTLMPDGRWQCTVPLKDQPPCDTDMRGGLWRLDGWRQIEFRDARGATVIAMPVITDRGRYRLLNVPDEDPDSWDVTTGYERVAGKAR